MIDTTAMTIGDVHFTIKNESGGPLLKPESAYRDFWFDGDGHPFFDSPDILIRILVGTLPNTESLVRILDNDLSWGMFKDGDDYLLTRHPPAFEQPYWVARIDRLFTKVTILINKEFIGGKDGKRRIENPVRYPLDQILLMYILASKQGALLHAAGLNLKGKGFIFPGKSGAGKSTITRQFAAIKNTKLLSDDRIIVRKIDNDFKAYGTPWPGEAGIALNESMPLANIFFINHGTTNQIKSISPRQALERLMPVTSIPWYDRDVIPKVLDFCEELVLNVPAYELDFLPNVEVVDVLEKILSV